MRPRQAIAATFILLLAFPLWGRPKPIGHVASCHAATVRGASLTPGSTVFSGDSIEVADQGEASVALAGGSQVHLGENSRVCFTKTAEAVRVTVERGGMSFRTGDKAFVEALLGDLTIHPVNGAVTVATIQVRNPQSALIAAEQGTLLLRTSRGSRSLTLRPGEGVEVTLIPGNAAESTRNGCSADPPPPGSWTAGTVAVVGVTLAGVTTAVGLLLRRKGRRLSDQDACNAVSPFRCF